MYNRPQNITQQAYELDRNLDRFKEFAEDEHKFDAEVINPKRHSRRIQSYFSGITGVRFIDLTWD